MFTASYEHEFGYSYDDFGKRVTFQNLLTQGDVFSLQGPEHVCVVKCCRCMLGERFEEVEIIVVEADDTGPGVQVDGAEYPVSCL